MYCLKGVCVSLLLAFILSGCAQIGAGITNQLRAPDPRDGPVYLEQIDNDEFLEFVLEENIIEGLKRENVIYVDNIYDARFRSNKVILAKDAFYNVYAEYIGLWPNYKVDIERLRKTYHSWFTRNTIHAYKYYYVTPKYLYKAEIELNDSFFFNYCKQSIHYNSCEELFLVIEYRGDRKWYRSKRTYWWDYIPHRYNDIYKIKAVIDERVAYFLSLENNQTNKENANAMD
jgi:hypothetical protein